MAALPLVTTRCSPIRSPALKSTWLVRSVHDPLAFVLQVSAEFTPFTQIVHVAVVLPVQTIRRFLRRPGSFIGTEHPGRSVPLWLPQVEFPPVTTPLSVPV